MKKMYQVFVSSTYEDLIDERIKVLNALLSFSCIPAGMELFSAGSDEQFDYIKRVIDRVDYYVLIVAGRYGSIAKDGKSYTEKEFDYAVKRGIPILVFMHKHPENLPAKYIEKTDVGKELLDAFRKKVCKDRMVAYWENADELSRKIISGLREEIEIYPRAGWIKGDEKISFDGELGLIIEELEQFKRNVRKQNSLINSMSSKGLHKFYRSRILKLNRKIEELKGGERRSLDIVDLTDKSIEELIAVCCDQFHNERIGSLIVIERYVPLDIFIETGIILDAELSSQLLSSIITFRTPLHDGAVIIRDNRIISASCYIPLTDNKDYVHLGTRHRAGIGLTEINDSVVIITSEETGNISIACNGKLYSKLSSKDFKELLTLLCSKTK